MVEVVGASVVQLAVVKSRSGWAVCGSSAKQLKQLMIDLATDRAGCAGSQAARPDA